MSVLDAVQKLYGVEALDALAKGRMRVRNAFSGCDLTALPGNSEKKRAALGPGTWCPFNGQNTTSFSDAFRYFICLPTANSV